MASLTVTLTHPAATKTATLTVTDARMLEFLDFLIAEQEVHGVEVPDTREESAQRYVDDVVAKTRKKYHGFKKVESERAASIPQFEDPD